MQLFNSFAFVDTGDDVIELSHLQISECRSSVGGDCTTLLCKHCGEFGNQIWFTPISFATIEGAPFLISEFFSFTVSYRVHHRCGFFVFPFGSVPLKTYLPDGDIDLTTFGIPNTEDTLASEVCAVLGEEEQNKDAKFEVKDVQLIRAEVKLVKCIVQNIVVDISFNQIGGLCTLCFLEKVDRKIGKNHLFKRSIMLIKAWCYYESRILGSHHGLISTYALEILVLYIFHLYHNYLDGPLAVLYMFLDYYSKFDWDNYCISLDGPVSISSLPNLVVEPPETIGSCLLLTEEFIKECTEMFSVPSRVYGNNYQVFAQKHLNIVDPLKQNNNLGRSVSKGNFYRIRSAFTYGAQKLGRILLLPPESIADEVNLFFKSTLDRHGSGERPDVQDAASSCLDSGTIRVESMLSNLKVEDVNKEIHLSSSSADDSNGQLCDKINTIKTSDMDWEHVLKKQPDRHSSSQNNNANWLHDCSKIGSIVPAEDVSGKHLVDDPRDLVSTRPCDSRLSDENCMASIPGKAYHASHLFFHVGNIAEDETVDNLNSGDGGMPRASSGRLTAPSDELKLEINASGSAKSMVAIAAGSIHETSPTISEDSSLGDCSNDGTFNNASSGFSKSSGLAGDYRLYFSNLQHAQEFQERISNPYLVPIYQASPSQYQSKHSWEMQSMYSHIGANGFVSASHFSPSYYVISPVICNDYGPKDTAKTRGTGTYLPDTNSRAYREKHSSGRGKNEMLTNHLSRNRKHSHMDTPQYGSLSEERNHWPSPWPQTPSMGNGYERPISLDVPQSSPPVSTAFSQSNGYAYPPERKLEFGSLGPVTVEVSSPGRGSNLKSANATGQGSGSAVPASTVERPPKSLKNEWLNQPYQLKDDGDFPPLAS
ncbi:unnamed protein product [Musa acuminata subsp. burmannicoides]